MASMRCNDASERVVSPPTPSAEYDLSCLAAFDISGSMDEREKRAACQFVSELLNRAVQRKAQVPVWEYAETCTQRAEYDVEFRKDIADELGRLIQEKRGTWGTRPGLVLRQFKGFCTNGRLKTSRTILLLATDGEMHDVEETREAARDLANMRTIQAMIVGPVHKEHWNTVQEAFSAFGNRLVIFSTSDRMRAIDEVVRLLQQGASE